MKPIIYQVLPRLFGNTNFDNDPTFEPRPNGTINENGVGKMEHFTQRILNKLQSKGYTHIWYTGIIDHATQTDYSAIGQPANHKAIVKGKAGSPYAIRDYYNVDADLATDPSHRFEEFENLIDRTHQAGLKVIIDFVPNHVARNYHSVSAPAGVLDLGADDRTDCHFSASNNFYYCVGESFSPQFDRAGYIEYPAKATGNDCFNACPSINDWYETIKLNYGIDYCNQRTKHFDPIPDTWHKMVEILEFWTSHNVDGFRCDMAEMVPAEFWHWAISRIKALNPDIIFIAEVYNPQLYREYIGYGGFDYLYDKVGLYDTLTSIIRHQAPASSITYAWQAVDDIKSHMLSFVENHDEIRITSGNDGTYSTRALANRGYVATAIAATMSGGATMIYAGQEVGERAADNEGFSGNDGKTTIFDYWKVDSLCRLQQYLDGKNSLTSAELLLYNKYARLLTTAHNEVISNGGFYDLGWLNTRNPQFDSDNTYAFLRHYANHIILVVANFKNEAITDGIALSSHVFETLGASPKTGITATDLLSKTNQVIDFTPNSRIKVTIPANDIICLSFDL